MDGRTRSGIGSLVASTTRRSPAIDAQDRRVAIAITGTIRASWTAGPLKRLLECTVSRCWCRFRRERVGERTHVSKNRPDLEESCVRTGAKATLKGTLRNT